MDRITKTNYYLNIALAVSKRSTCLKRHYGCIIVKNDEIIATGYNGSPRGTVNCCDTGVCKRMGVPHNVGDYSDCCSVHAEQNAMLSAPRRDMIGATLYLACEDWIVGYEDERMKTIKYQEWREIKNPSPCPICARMIMNAGIASVVNKCGSLCLGKLV